jgi:phosphoserine phosphatase
LAGITELLQQAGRVNLRLQEGLQAQVATELGHDQQVVHAAATEAAMFLGNRHRTQAQFCHLVPEHRAHAGFAVVIAFAGFEAVVVAGQSGHGVLQHLLLGAECEVHCVPP